ncbi:hypothetical protein SB48_HM08orf01300 [Heyndrickxia coagulans]|uniref:Uncharacterized protein n=1 Tax=Heyndrickxia coagulans TaxID=1398 RepID=A0AAN0T2Q6_HEYCO|nr:hypothetical protein SB48_HM08orf01300 [Heyndrickxia coagulans]
MLQHEDKQENSGLSPCCFSLNAALYFCYATNFTAGIPGSLNPRTLPSGRTAKHDS